MADWLVALTLAVAFWGGYRSGVVREAIGMLALIIAWSLAGTFAGTMSPALQKNVGLSPASSHLASFWLLFLFVFGATRAAGWVVERMTAQPALRVVSGIGGGIVACAKAILALWLVLFVALFFPIAPDVRATLRKSPTVAAIEALDRPAYAMLIASLPHRARPFVRVFLDHHHL
ncbi:MAG TPA: CvpA family protein [Candidatus Eremiobacteraceae bacterium]|nr:CvpA family protein [Candidatus Eremiobacteraceae bacterium]